MTKYRRKTLNAELLDYLRGAFVDCLAAWRCHLIHPALNISVLINNLKTASARRARIRFAQHLGAFYSKPLFWHRAYYVGSVGGATLETVRAYVDAQGTVEHARKSEAKRRKPPA